MSKRRKRRNSIVDIILPLILINAFAFVAKFKMHLPLPNQLLMLLVGLLFLAFVTALLSMKPNRRTFNHQPKLEEMDRLSGEDFEDALLYTLKRKGWRVKTTPKTGDYGADLVGHDQHGRSVVIQAKRWSKNVGTDAVNQALAAKAYYQADHAMIITNRYLTRQAFELARKTNIELWTRKKLASEISNSHHSTTTTSV